jgi:hypothetical protein
MSASVANIAVPESEIKTSKGRSGSRPLKMIVAGEGSPPRQRRRYESRQKFAANPRRGDRVYSDDSKVNSTKRC